MADEGGGMLGLGCETSAKAQASALRVAATCLAYAFCLIASSYLLRHDRVPAGPAAWLVAALPSLAAVFVLMAFVRFLRGADEVQRMIQLQALALGFGGGFFVIMGYAQFEHIGAPASRDIIAVMPFLYVFGVFLGWKRYR